MWCALWTTSAERRVATSTGIRNQHPASQLWPTLSIQRVQTQLDGVTPSQGIPQKIVPKLQLYKPRASSCWNCLLFFLWLVTGQGLVLYLWLDTGTPFCAYLFQDDQLLGATFHIDQPCLCDCFRFQPFEMHSKSFATHALQATITTQAYNT